MSKIGKVGMRGRSVGRGASIDTNSVAVVDLQDNADAAALGRMWVLTASGEGIEKGVRLATESGRRGNSRCVGKGVFGWQMSRLHFVPLDMTTELIWWQM